MAWKQYCPMMKALCVEGHTREMGEDADGRQIVCAYFVTLAGSNPQTGEPINEGKCAINWLPILTIENSNEQRKTAASVDKVATEVSKTRDIPIQIELTPPQAPRLSLNGSKPD